MTFLNMGTYDVREEPVKNVHINYIQSKMLYSHDFAFNNGLLGLKPILFFNSIRLDMKILLSILSMYALMITFPLGDTFSVKPSIAGPTKIYNLKIEKREVIGNKRLIVNQNDTVTLSWLTDEDVELHLHGYDIEKTVLKGKTATMKIEANLTGRFPITSHGFGKKKGHSHGKGALLYLEVHPN